MPTNLFILSFVIISTLLFVANGKLPLENGPKTRSGGIRYHRLLNIDERTAAANSRLQQEPKADYFEHYKSARNKKMTEETLKMIKFAFSNYKDNAFPESDEVRPHSCTGKNNSLLGSGTFAATLVDSLDTLAIVGMQREFWEAVSFVCHNLSRRVFGADYRDDPSASSDGGSQNENDSCGWAPFSGATTSSSFSVEHIAPLRRCPVQPATANTEQQPANPLSTSPCGCPYSDPLRSSPKVNPHLSGFETNIRLIGGLLSGHFMIEEGIVSPIADEETDDDMSGSTTKGVKVYGYDGCLLRLAIAIGRQLLPLFSTATGIPFGSFFFRDGVMKGEVQQTSVADAGTYLLEFTILSRVSGDPRFEAVAKRAVRAIYKRRHPLTNLLGTHINVTTGAWTVPHSSVGSGVDSYLEYLVKQFILTGEKEFYLMFDVLHRGIYSFLRMGSGELDNFLQNRTAATKEIKYKAGATLFSANELSDHKQTNIQTKPHSYYQTNMMSGYNQYFQQPPDGFRTNVANFHDADGKPMKPSEELVNQILIRHLKRAHGNMEHGSLCNFYPGLLALAGHIDEAKVGLITQQSVWDAYGAFPESEKFARPEPVTEPLTAARIRSLQRPTKKFWTTLGKLRDGTPEIQAGPASTTTKSIAEGARMTTSDEYPLRPEHIESLYILSEMTNDDTFVEAAKRVVKAVEARTRTRCGYGGVENVFVSNPPLVIVRRLAKEAPQIQSSPSIPLMPEIVMPSALRDAYFGADDDAVAKEYMDLENFTPNMVDEQESFAISETLKYGYLIFSQKEREMASLAWEKRIASGRASTGGSASFSNTRGHWTPRPFLHRGSHSSVRSFSAWQERTIRECLLKNTDETDPLSGAAGALCASAFSRRHSLLWVFNTEGHPFPVRPEWSPALSASPRASAALYRHWIRCCPQQALWRGEDGVLEGGVQRVAARRAFGTIADRSSKGGKGSTLDLASLASIEKDSSLVPYGFNDMYYGCAGDHRTYDPTRNICGEAPIAPPRIEDTFGPVGRGTAEILEEEEPLHPLTEPLRTLTIQGYLGPPSHWRGIDQLDTYWRDWVRTSKAVEAGKQPKSALEKLSNVLQLNDHPIFNATKDRLMTKALLVHRRRLASGLPGLVKDISPGVSTLDHADVNLELRKDADDTPINCPNPHGPRPYYLEETSEPSDQSTANKKKQSVSGANIKTTNVKFTDEIEPYGPNEATPTSQLENIFYDDDSYFESQLSPEYFMLRMPHSYMPLHLKA